MSNSIQTMVSAYKRDVAGRYHSISPDCIERDLPPGPFIVSEKIDGETWFIHTDGEHCVLLSPFGKRLENIPITVEAQNSLNGWRGLLAGELYANVNSGRPRVFDLHAAMGSNGNPEHLRFAAFDVLLDGENNMQRRSFAERMACLQQLIDQHERPFHLSPLEKAETQADVTAHYKRIVTVGGAEGVVIHASDGRTYKVKPEIVIDAAVVGYAEGGAGVSELLLSLVKPNGDFQLIGRVKTGWSNTEKAELAKRLTPFECSSSYRKANDHGLLYRWVKPELVVEVKCNDLIAVNSKNDFIRRMALQYIGNGWSPIGPAPSVSMINAVFRRIREDKRAVRPDVRIEQVSDLVPIVKQASIDPASLPDSDIIRREVYTKRNKTGLAVRKLVCWKTNKQEVDSAYPPYVVFFTDYSPGRKQPLKTDILVASTQETIHSFADDWLAANIKQGWENVSSNDCRVTNEKNQTRDDLSAPRILNSEFTARHLKISFARSTSPTFPIIRRRLDALAKLGSLEITSDEKGREAWFELSISNGLVENAKRIDNLLKIVKGWKTTEVSLDGELIGKHDLQDFMNHLEDARRCWLKRKKHGPDACKRNCTLGCDALSIWPTHEWLSYSGCNVQAWWAIGSFDGERVVIDKAPLKTQLDTERHEAIRICPNFDKEAIIAKIDALPDTIEADDHWITLWVSDPYNTDSKPVWLWPAEEKTPPTLRKTKDNPWRDGGMNIQVDLGLSNENQNGDEDRAIPERDIPPTRYADVVGQDRVVEAVRDLIELPLKHAELFTRIGAKPKAGGVILAGPPGTGKTLLARAVAGECDAHIESVSGPELLSKWVGATEEALRSIFERAKSLAPSVILFDEIDCLAVSRGSAEAQYQKSMVTQLLALLDGLEDRGNIFVIATTNRPDDIDSALRRPGRFDQTIHMGPPDETGRAAIFRHYLKPLVLDPNIDRNRLAVNLASLTSALTGADIAHLCQRAALLCVKEATQNQLLSETLAIRKDHFEKAVRNLASGFSSNTPATIDKRNSSQVSVNVISARTA